MRYFAELVPALFYLLWFSSCYEASAKDKVIALSEVADVVEKEDVFEDSFSQAEDQRREKLKSLGFHEQVSFDSFHQFLDRVKRAAGNKGKSSFFKLLTDAFEVVYGRKRELASLGTLKYMHSELKPEKSTVTYTYTN